MADAGGETHELRAGVGDCGSRTCHLSVSLHSAERRKGRKVSSKLRSFIRTYQSPILSHCIFPLSPFGILNRIIVLCGSHQCRTRCLVPSVGVCQFFSLIPRRRILNKNHFSLRHHLSSIHIPSAAAKTRSGEELRSSMFYLCDPVHSYCTDTLHPHLHCDSSAPDHSVQYHLRE
jgi:hypothetical protein